MSDYFILGPAREDQYCKVAMAPQDFPSLNPAKRGRSMSDEWPENAEFRMKPRHPGLMVPDVVLNPRVVFEVLSKSTESYDRGEKQAGYLALASVEHLVLVSQREPRVEVYTREAAGSFHYQVFGAGSTVELRGINVTIPVDDLYDGAFELPGDEAESVPTDAR